MHTQGENSRAKRIMKQLFRIDRYHKALIDAQVSRLGIHRSQLHMLMHLHFCQEVPTQEKIAKTLEISPAAVAATLKKMEAAGLVERVVRKENGREKEVRLTPEGEEIVGISFELFDTADTVITEGFSDGELDGLENYLDRVTENLKNAAPPGPEGNNLKKQDVREEKA